MQFVSWISFYDSETWFFFFFLLDNSKFFLVRILPYLDRLRRFTSYISAFSPNTGKHGPEKLRIWTLFTLWVHLLLLALITVIWFWLSLKWPTNMQLFPNLLIFLLIWLSVKLVTAPSSTGLFVHEMSETVSVF